MISTSALHARFTRKWRGLPYKLPPLDLTLRRIWPIRKGRVQIAEIDEGQAVSGANREGPAATQHRAQLFQPVGGTLMKIHQGLCVKLREQASTDAPTPTHHIRYPH